MASAKADATSARKRAAKDGAARDAKQPATGRAGLSAEERAAARERARELKSETGEKELLAKIAQMPAPERAIAQRLHEIIRNTAPDLSPRTWYGMPAYANEQGKVVCFFRNAAKFKERYSTLGFNDSANLDEGAMWPVAYALTDLGAAEEDQIRALLRRAVGPAA